VGLDFFEVSFVFIGDSVNGHLALEGYGEGAVPRRLGLNHPGDLPDGPGLVADVVEGLAKGLAQVTHRTHLAVDGSTGLKDAAGPLAHLGTHLGHGTRGLEDLPGSHGLFCERFVESLGESAQVVQLGKDVLEGLFGGVSVEGRLVGQALDGADLFVDCLGMARRGVGFFF